MAQPSSQGGKGSFFKLQGVLLPVKTANGKEEDDEVEEDDDDEPEPLDVLPEDSSQLSFCQPSRRSVIIKEEKSQMEYQVFGRFPFIDPWWKVNVKVKKAGSKNYAQGSPSYFLQTYPRNNQKEVIALFLKACMVPENLKQAFFQWLPEWLPKNSSLNFKQLEEILNQFMMSKRDTIKDCGSTTDVDIFHYIKNSSTLEQKVQYLLEDSDPKHTCFVARFLEAAEMLKIIRKELHTYIGEAPWKAFCEFPHLLEKIPDLQKNALTIYAKLQKRCRDRGHTYEELDVLMRMVPEMSTEHAWQSLTFMKDEKIVVIEGKRVFLQKLYEAEKNIALVVYELIEKSPWKFHVDVRKVLNSGACINDSKDPVVENKLNYEEPCEMGQEEPNSTSYVQENVEETTSKETQCEAEVDPDQENAMELICSNPVTIMSGKGGCGKTTVVSYLFRYLNRIEVEEATRACEDFEADLDTSQEWETSKSSFQLNSLTGRSESLEVLFTAPTGRAAGLLRKKTDLPAYTLHQVVYSYYSGTKPWKFSKVKVLVVDEGSLVSVAILSRVLQLLFCNAQLAKLVILGDIRQLPSIEPGNVLCDVFESLKLRGWSVELRTNHRAESQLIVDNSIRISQRMYPEFDAVLRISHQSKTWPMPSSEKKFIFVVLSSEDNLVPAIKALLKGGPGLEDAEQSQFISFRRKDCNIINELCCQHYSNHPMRNHKKQLQFQCGDKICSTRNAYIRDLLPNDKSCTKNVKGSGPCTCDVCFTKEDCLSGRNPPSHENGGDTRLCNGDIFFIEEDREVDTRRLLTIRSTDESTYTLLYRGLLRVSKIQHAWARTIHTFQGSEEKTVVYVVGNAGRQNWQHVYTAVTRGRSRVYIVAEEANLRKAIVQKEFPRKTYLRKHLQDAFMGKMDSFEETFSSQRSVHSKEHNICDSASHTGNNCINLEQAAVSDEIKDDNRVRTVELAELSLHSDGLKRQSDIPEDSSSPSKVILIAEENSPLGTRRLQNLTLEGPVPKKLFPL